MKNPSTVIEFLVMFLESLKSDKISNIYLFHHKHQQQGVSHWQVISTYKIYIETILHIL